MEDLVAGVIGMAVILLIVVIHLIIQWVDKLEFKSNLDYLEKDIEELEEQIDKNWTQEISDFNSLNKRVKKLEKEREQPTVSNECFPNEYYERAKTQALETSKYAEFLARESVKQEAKQLEDEIIVSAYLKSQDNKRINREIRERIQELEAIPYEFRTDTEREVLRSIQLTDPRNNINNK